MAVIDIGSTAEDRATVVAPFTLIEANNPANADGKITSIEIFAASGEDLVDCEVATFIHEGSNVFSTRDSVVIGSVTGGSKQVFPVDLDVEAGDYIGIFFSDGQIEKDNTGNLMWFKAGDNIPCTSETFSQSSAGTLSLYGEGGGVTHEASVTFAGAASMAVNAVVTYAGAVTFSGVGTLSVNAYLGETLEASVAFSGAGALSINAVVTYAGAVSFSGEGSMAINAVMTYAGKVTFSGEGALSVNGVLIGIIEASVTFSGSGSLAILGGLLHSASITFGGVGTLSISGSYFHKAKVFFLGRGLMSCNGVLTLAAAVSFAGEGFMTIKARYLGALFVECITTHYRNVEVLTTHNKQVEALTTHNKQIDSKITGG